MDERITHVTIRMLHHETPDGLLHRLHGAGFAVMPHLCPGATLGSLVDYIRSLPIEDRSSLEALVAGANRNLAPDQAPQRHISHQSFPGPKRQMSPPSFPDHQRHKMSPPRHSASQRSMSPPRHSASRRSMSPPSFPGHQRHRSPPRYRTPPRHRSPPSFPDTQRHMSPLSFPGHQRHMSPPSFPSPQGHKMSPPRHSASRRSMSPLRYPDCRRSVSPPRYSASRRSITPPRLPVPQRPISPPKKCSNKAIWQQKTAVTLDDLIYPQDPDPQPLSKKQYRKARNAADVAAKKRLEAAKSRIIFLRRQFPKELRNDKEIEAYDQRIPNQYARSWVIALRERDEALAAFRENQLRRKPSSVNNSDPNGIFRDGFM